MSSSLFASPEDAETAFYDAIERADLEAMMAIWADDEKSPASTRPASG